VIDIYLQYFLTVLLKLDTRLKKNIMLHPFSSHHPVGIDLQAKCDHGAIVYPHRSDQQIGLQFEGRLEGQN
jgi:hypothetical protein